MRLRYRIVMAGLLLFATLVVLALATGSLKTLAVSHWSLFAAAAALHSAQFWAFAITWAFFLSRIQRGKSNLRTDYNRSVRVSLAALAGMLTPMNLGTDVLRSWFGKTHLDLDYALTGAATVRARECKAQVTLVVASAVTFFAVSLSPVLIDALAIVLIGLLGFVLTLRGSRSRYAARMAEKRGSLSLAQAVKAAGAKVGWISWLGLAVVLALGFVADWQGLCLCLRALDLRPDLTMTFVSYGAIYFLSRTPLIPLGVGVVETAGFGFLLIMGLQTDQAGALLVMWGFMRVAVPYSLAAAAYSSLLLESWSRRCEKIEPERRHGLPT